jgi:dTDP-4-amino-4,6-dideoxygalactose transaminase
MPKGIAGAVATAKEAGLTPKAIIPVDLFGLPADHGAVRAAASAENLLVLDDAAQAFGATYNNRRLGTFGQATATSFFPAKPLGCYGDGGAVMTDDDGSCRSPPQPACAWAGE